MGRRPDLQSPIKQFSTPRVGLNIVFLFLTKNCFISDATPKEGNSTNLIETMAAASMLESTKPELSACSKCNFRKWSCILEINSH